MKTDSILGQFWTGIAAYKKAFVVVRREKLRHWYFIIGSAAVGCMLLVRAVVDAGADWLELLFFAPIHGHIREVIFSRGGEDWEWVSTGVEGVVNGAMFFLGLWVQFKVAKFIVLLALSPLFAALAEVVGNRFSGRQLQNSGAKNWVWSICRGLKSALLLIVLEAFMGFFLFVIFFVLPLIIPGVGVFTWWLFPILSGAVSVWFYGAALLDYVWEQERFDARESLQASWSGRGGALALGLPFYVVMAVPFIGWILGPLFGGMMGMVAAFRWNSMRTCSAVE